ncbi:MAG: ribosome maturation factor RimM [Elusimicrobiota bacterium]
MKNLVLAGRILRPHGLRGELVVQPLLFGSLDFNNVGAFHELPVPVYLLDKPHSDSTKLAEIIGFRLHQNNYLIKLAGFDSLEKVESLRNWYLGVEAVDLPADKFYVQDLLGIKVYGEDKRYLGEVVEVFATGANDIWVIRDGKKELLFPALKKLVKKIDLEGKTLEIKLAPGLEEINE